MSTGQATSNDYFLDSSPDGKNVFFGTHSKLVPADQDEEGDLYDARIDGGFPAPSARALAKATPAHALAAPPDPIPALLAAPSAVNLATAPPPTKTVTKTVKCKQGFVKRKVKTKTECVKKAKAKKASNKRGARR